MRIAVIHPYRENVHRMYQSFFFMPERGVQTATHLDNVGFDVDFIDFGQTNLDDDHHYTVKAPPESNHRQMMHYGWTPEEIDRWFDINGDDYSHYVVDALTPYFRDGVEQVHSNIQRLETPMMFFGEWPQLVPGDFQDTPAVRDNWEMGVEAWLTVEASDSDEVRDIYPGVDEPGVTPFPFDEFPMDTTPAPNWRKFVDMEGYPEPHCADVRFSRGCVERCDFCHVAGMYDGRFNFKTADKIKTDLEDLIDRQGFTKIKIRDDNFCAATNTAKEVFEWIGENHPKIEIMQPEGMEMRTASRDKELIQAIGKCNYHSIRVGFETATEGKFSKNKLEWWEIAHQWFKEAGFGPGEIVTFVIRGHPKMDREDEIHTAIYLSQFDVTMVSGGYRLVPGTHLWKDYAEEHGREPPYSYGFGLPVDDPLIDEVGRLYRTVSRWNEWQINLFDDDFLNRFEELSWIDNVVDNGSEISTTGTVSGWRRTEGIRYGFAYELARRGYYDHTVEVDDKREMVIKGHKGNNKFMRKLVDCLDERGIEVNRPGGLL